jgi:MerR family redox-sensitive transcriptional activator SoxR
VLERWLTIGQLARRAGVATSALRYWEQIGLLEAPQRISGQRRYPEAAVEQVGALLLRRDAGFTLAELKALTAADRATQDELLRRKLAELDEQIARAQAAREAIEHGLRCPHDDVRQCPNFRRLVAARLDGEPLQQAHARLRAQ